MKEGKLLKEYIQKKNIKARQICFDIGRSSNYMQVQYNKDKLPRNVISLLDEYFKVDILKEIGVKGDDITEKLTKSIVPSDKGKRKRVIIDFLDGNIINLETINM